MSNTTNSPSWLAVATCTAGLALIGLAAPSLAADEKPRTATEQTTVIKVIRKSDDGTTTESTIEADGEVKAAMAKCADGKKIDEVTETKGDKGEVHRSRIVMCMHGDADAKSTVERLEEARKRVSDLTELSGDAKAKALAALDQEIARLKSASSDNYSRQ
jgi:hypothetical protein